MLRVCFVTVKVTAEMEEKDKEEKAISAGIYSYGVWESTV